MGKQNLVQVKPSRRAMGDWGRLSLFGTKAEVKRQRAKFSDLQRSKR